jgi:hypothetical protein
MYNGGKIIIGLIVFILVVTLPFTYNIVAKSALKGAPELEILPKAGDKCVRDKDYMRAYHMDLLIEWREKVVREGERFTAGPHGGQIEMSLSNTCMDCHSNRDNFCNKCHNYMDVDPYCWDCHNTPDETENPQPTQMYAPKEGN